MRFGDGMSSSSNTSDVPSVADGEVKVKTEAEEEVKTEAKEEVEVKTEPEAVASARREPPTDPSALQEAAAEDVAYVLTLLKEVTAMLAQVSRGVGGGANVAPHSISLPHSTSLPSCSLSHHSPPRLGRRLGRALLECPRSATRYPRVRNEPYCEHGWSTSLDARFPPHTPL